MELVKKVSAFLGITKIKEIIYDFTKEKYIEERFQNKLHNLQEVMYKAHFNYEKPTFSFDNIYHNEEKNIKLEIKFTLDKYNVNFIFKDNNDKELFNIEKNYNNHLIKMQGTKITDREKITELLELMGVNTVFNEVWKTCSLEHIKQKVMKEDQAVLNIIGDTINKKIDVEEQAYNEGYAKNANIYFDIVNLSLNKMLKEKRLKLEGDKFSNFKISEEKHMTCLHEDLNVKVNEFQHNALSLKIISRSYVPVYESDDNRACLISLQINNDKHEILRLDNDYKYYDLRNNELKHKKPIDFILYKDSWDKVQSQENKEKLLSYINAFPLFEQTKDLLVEANKQLDIQIEEKQKEIHRKQKEEKDLENEKFKELVETRTQPTMKMK